MENIKKERRWCIWKLEIRNDTFTKVPYINPDTHGRSNAPDTWIDYETASGSSVKDMKAIESEGMASFFHGGRETLNTACVLSMWTRITPKAG